MNEIHRSPVREQLISYLRDRLAENGMMITEESLEFTAERYAAMIISNPKLDAAMLIDADIAKVRGLLNLINTPH